MEFFMGHLVVQVQVKMGLTHEWMEEEAAARAKNRIFHEWRGSMMCAFSSFTWFNGQAAEYF